MKSTDPKSIAVRLLACACLAALLACGAAATTGPVQHPRANRGRDCGWSPQCNNHHSPGTGREGSPAFVTTWSSSPMGQPWRFRAREERTQVIGQTGAVCRAVVEVLEDLAVPLPAG